MSDHHTLHGVTRLRLALTLILLLSSSSPGAAQYVPRWEISDSSGIAPAAIDALDSLNYAVCESHFDLSTQYAAERVRTSSDGGRTWTVLRELTGSTMPKYREIAYRARQRPNVGSGAIAAGWCRHDYGRRRGRPVGGLLDLD